MSVKSIYVDIVRLIPLPPSPATFLLSPVGLRPPRTLRPFFPGAISDISLSPLGTNVDERNCRRCRSRRLPAWRGQGIQVP